MTIAVEWSYSQVRIGSYSALKQRVRNLSCPQKIGSPQSSESLTWTDLKQPLVEDGFRGNAGLRSSPMLTLNFPASQGKPPFLRAFITPQATDLAHLTSSAKPASTNSRKCARSVFAYAAVV